MNKTKILKSTGNFFDDLFIATVFSHFDPGNFEPENQVYRFVLKLVQKPFVAIMIEKFENKWELSKLPYAEFLNKCGKIFKRADKFGDLKNRIKRFI